MEIDLLSLDNKAIDKVTLNDDIFCLEYRFEIIKMVIDWQRAKAMSGTHKVKNVGEVSGTTRKPFKQKGTGNARQGNVRAVQLRGGGVAHGPVVRSHAFKLPKKVRNLGLRYALSEKRSSGKLYVIDSFELADSKCANLCRLLSNFGSGSFLAIDGDAVHMNFKRAISNIPNSISMPAVGANVYDIVNYDHLLLSKNGLSLLEERLVR